MTRLALEGPRAPPGRHPCSSLAAAPMSGFYCRRSSSSSLRRYSSGGYSSYSSVVGKACCSSGYMLPHVSSSSAAHGSSSSKRHAQSAEYPPVSASHIIATHLEQQMQQQQSCGRDARSLFGSVVDAIERHILHSDPSGNVRLSARRLNIGRCPEVPEHTATFALRRSGSLHWLPSEEETNHTHDNNNDKYNNKYGNSTVTNASSNNDCSGGFYRRKNTGSGAHDNDNDSDNNGSDGSNSNSKVGPNGSRIHRSRFDRGIRSREKHKNKYKGMTAPEETGSREVVADRRYPVANGNNGRHNNETVMSISNSNMNEGVNDGRASDGYETKTQQNKPAKRSLLGQHSVSAPRLTDLDQRADSPETVQEEIPPATVGVRRTFSWHGLKSRFKK